MDDLTVVTSLDQQTVSPTGGFFAYTRPDRISQGPLTGRNFLATGASGWRNGNVLYILDLKTQKTREVTAPGTTSWGLRWSPNGRHLAFYSDCFQRAALCVWTPGATSVKATPGVIARGDSWGDQSPEWGPDSLTLYFLALPPGTYGDLSSSSIGGSVRTDAVARTRASAAIKPDTGANQEVNAFGFEAPQDIDVVQTNIATGKVTRIHRGPEVRRIALSPDGNFLADVENRREESSAKLQGQFLFDMWVYPTKVPPNSASRQPCPLMKRIRSAWGTSVSWSPNSRQIAYATGGTLSDRSIYVCDAVSGGNLVNVTECAAAMDRTVPRMSREDDRSPIAWTMDGRWIARVKNDSLWLISTDGKLPPRRLGTVDLQIQTCLTADDTSIVFQKSDRLVVWAARKGRHGLYRVPLDGSTPSIWCEHIGSCKSISGFRQVVVFTETNVTHPCRLWSAIQPSQGQVAPTLLEDFNRQLPRFSFVDPISLSWNETTGQEDDGLLFLPREASRRAKAPLVVWFYPGDQFSAKSAGMYRFDLPSFEPDFFTARGYALLLAGSHYNGNCWELAQQLESALAAGVDTAVATEVIDGKRVGIMGQSFGGFGVDALITRTERFQAAVSCAGVGDYIASYLSGDFPTHYFESGQGSMDGTLWEHKERYLSSPVLMLDKVTTPTLFTDGEGDYPDQARMMFNGLDRLGKPAMVAIYRHGGHYWSTWTAPQQVDFFNRVFAWFDKYLMPGKRSRLDPTAQDLSIYYPDGSGRLINQVDDIPMAYKQILKKMQRN